MSAIHFWHDHVGRHLDASIAADASTGAMVPHRTLKGVKPLRLGAIDAYYIASAAGSQLIGRIDLPSRGELAFVPTESVSARKHMAEWLVSNAQAPFMGGVIGNANPNASMTISHTLSRCTFCEAGGGFFFDLNRVRTAVQVFSEMNWKSEVAPAIHQYARLRDADPETRPMEQAKLLKLLTKQPALQRTLTQADIRPGSGEYTILSWLNIERA